ncbi:MAG: hypothetical protein LBS91_06985 [Clostridiales Family XIII bacterium]|jgi:hypothetical protein|nr:hypothetical protein [Clostridiales Family XIII bacterium]
MSIRVKVIIVMPATIALVCAANLADSLSLTQANLYRAAEGGMAAASDIAGDKGGIGKDGDGGSSAGGCAAAPEAIRGIAAEQIGDMAGVPEKEAKAKNGLYIRQYEKGFLLKAEALIEPIDEAPGRVQAQQRKLPVFVPGPELIDRLADAIESFGMDDADKGKAPFSKAIRRDMGYARGKETIYRSF